MVKAYLDKGSYKKDIQKLKLLNEFKHWYMGDAELILKYYKRGEYIRDKQLAGLTDASLFTRGFYSLAPVGSKFNTVGGYQINSFSVLHRPLAKVISRTFAVLIAGQAPETVISTKNKKRTAEVQSIIDKILDTNNFASKMQLSCEYESYSGAVAFKPILTVEVNEPLFQIYPKDRFIINESFESVLNSVVFIDYFTDDKKNCYTLLSEYGRGFIRYKLLDKSNVEVKLSTIAELADLHDLELYTTDGEQYDKVLAVVQKNRGTGESDYKDQIDNFQAVDEAFSIMINLIRKSQPKRIVTESTLIHGQDSNGNPIYTMPDSYDNDVIVLWDNKREGSQEEKNELQPAPNIQNPIQAYRSIIDSALLDIASSVGLSSKTLSGIEEAGANASAEALGLRNNVDYRTRDLKLQSWRKSIKDLVKLLLVMNSINGDGAITETYDDIDININFYDPANFQAGTPSVEQKIDTILKAYKGGLIDLAGALNYVWGDNMSEEDINLLLEKLNRTGKQPWKNTPENSDIDSDLEGELVEEPEEAKEE